MNNLIWFREDLRIQDNSALYHATQLPHQGLIGIFFITPYFWKLHDMASCKINFILQNLIQLQDSLKQLNIPLIVFQSNSNNELVKQLFHFSLEHKIQAIFYNMQYEVNEMQRDKLVETAARKHNIKIFSFHDQLVFKPGKVVKSDGGYYTIFTPYKTAWLNTYRKEGGISILPTPKLQPKLSLIHNQLPEELTSSILSNISIKEWIPSETAAHNLLQNFIDTRIKDYHLIRDFPALSSTSKLSPYLTIGVLSPRQCLAAALNLTQGLISPQYPGIYTWITELIWREFYKTILIVFPRVSMNQPFKLETNKILWENNKDLFAAWKNGLTGFPIVDAGMRQLNKLGWMHNRLRMITAMFLVKLLLIDWRWGEKYFMQNLIDGDLSANNGGWQWCASTGTDAVPYFRIFNPITQSQRFDRDGTFIKQFCPELKNFNYNEIHEPHRFNPALANKVNYPKPIINYAKARAKTIAIFKSLKIY